MAKQNGNRCNLELTITEVEVKSGAKGPWAKAKGYYIAEDRERNALQVEVRFTAFGVHAERLASVKGKAVNIELAMGGWRNDQGKVWPDYTCTSLSRPWGDTGGGLDPDLRDPNPRAVAEQEDDLPF